MAESQPIPDWTITGDDLTDAALDALAALLIDLDDTSDDQRSDER